MNKDDIASRMKDYFERQIGWFESMLGDLATLEADLEGANPDKLAEQQKRHERGTRSLEEEFRSLLHEWESTDTVKDAQRQELRRLARQAEGLSGKLQAKMDCGAELAAQRMASLSEAFGQIRQGKTLVGKYRADRAIDPSYVDRKA